MLTRDGTVKILDFGLAKILGGDAETATRMTAAGMALGTIAYMAPEQARGEEVDARADIWAFGVMAYEMLGGHLPFHGGSSAAMLLAILSESPTTLRQLRADLPDDLTAVVEKALAKNRDERTITADEIVSRLSAMQSSSRAGWNQRPCSQCGGEWVA